jgi:hypothetical protein
MKKVDGKAFPGKFGVMTRHKYTCGCRGGLEIS